MSSEYKTSEVELLKALAAEVNVKKQTVLMIAFSKKFTMAPPLWKRLISILETRFNAKVGYWKGRSLLQFYILEFGQKNDPHYLWSNLKKMVRNFEYSRNKEAPVNALQKCATFPHGFLTNFDDFWFNQYKPISIRTLRLWDESKVLYEKISSNFDNFELWFEDFKGFDNVESVIANVELYLGMNEHWLRRDVWKQYIDYLCDKGLKEESLNAFRRYTRLFTDDEEMVQRYREEIKKYTDLREPVAEWWLDTVKFENDFRTSSSALKVLQDFLAVMPEINDNGFLKPELNFEKTFSLYSKKLLQFERLETEKKPKVLKRPLKPQRLVFKPSTRSQSFAIPMSYVTYILHSANSNVLRNLFYSSKYFFSKHPTPICYSLKLADWAFLQHMIQESLLLNFNYFESLNFKNLIVTSSLTCSYQNDPYALSKLIRHLHRCELQELRIYGYQILTIEELNFLITPGKTMPFILQGEVIILNEEGLALSREEARDIIDFFYTTWLNSQHLSKCLTI